MTEAIQLKQKRQKLAGLYLSVSIGSQTATPQTFMATRIQFVGQA